MKVPVQPRHTLDTSLCASPCVGGPRPRHQPTRPTSMYPCIHAHIHAHPYIYTCTHSFCLLTFQTTQETFFERINNSDAMVRFNAALDRIYQNYFVAVAFDVVGCLMCECGSGTRHAACARGGGGNSLRPCSRSSLWAGATQHVNLDWLRFIALMTVLRITTGLGFGRECTCTRPCNLPAMCLRMARHVVVVTACHAHLPCHPANLHSSRTTPLQLLAALNAPIPIPVLFDIYTDALVVKVRTVGFREFVNQ